MKNAILPAILAVFVLLSISASVNACPDSYNYNREILNITDKPNPFLVNGTNGVIIEGEKQLIWCDEKANYICYNGKTDYACYNGKTKVTTLVDEGSGTSYGTITGLVSFYSLNDTNDISGNGYSCTVYDDAINTNDGKIGKAYEFDGTNGRLNCSFMSEFANHNRFSMEIWITMDALTTHHYLNYYTDSPPAPLGDRGTMLRTDGINNMHILWSTSGGFSEADGSGIVTDGTWYHYSWDWDGTTFYSYLDGVQDWVNVRGGTMSDFTSTYPNFYIGGHRSISITNVLDGKIDNVMVWNISRGQAEINLSYYSVEYNTITVGNENLRPPPTTMTTFLLLKLIDLPFPINMFLPDILKTIVLTIDELNVQSMNINGLRSNYGNGEAYLCIYNNGTIFSKEAPCS